MEFDAEGKVVGVTSEGETARCKKVVCDPSYLPDKVGDSSAYTIKLFSVVTKSSLVTVNNDPFTVFVTAVASV